MILLKQQQAKDKIWIDENGIQIPYDRTTISERLKEKETFSIYKDALAINEKLKSLKLKILETVENILKSSQKEYGIKLKSKGNCTFYNFNKTIKIEVNVYEPIRFDEIKIEMAKEILFSIIRENIRGDNFIIDLVQDAFQTSTGKLDTKKVLGLKKYTSKIKNEGFKKEWVKAMNIIDESISRTQSKTYFKIWVRNDDGEYEGIDLNFSNVKIPKNK